MSRSVHRGARCWLRFLTGFAASLLMFAGSPALAWSGLGHELVGELAQSLLTPEAHARVDELLQGEPDPTLRGVATWADTLRASDPERFKATANWHFVNLSQGICRVVESRDCRDGACVVGAIETQRRLLSDPAQSLEVRRDALKFIVHFVGDIHQPLHSSNRPDRGGNDFAVRLRTDIQPEAYALEHYQNGVMDTNLHAVWDFYLLRSRLGPGGLAREKYAQQLAAGLRLPRTAQGGPRAWAAESCRLIDRRSIYPAGHELDEKYLDAMRPFAEQRIRQAAQRLARLLNEVFRRRK